MPIHVRSKRSVPEKPAPQGAPAQKPGELPFGLPPPPAGWPQKPAGISLCMIVKNEEKFLAQALRSVHDVVDEIVIVDTGSTDRTIEIAKSFGATVLEHPWRNDFAWARNKSIEPATKRWIFFMDADEELLPQSKPALLQLKNAPAYRTAIWTRLYNKADDYKGTGEMSHALIRIFPNDPEIRFRGLIHEFPTVGEDINGLPGRSSPIALVHHGYVKEVVEERSKGERNLAIVKAATEAEPDEPYHWFNLGATAFLCNDYITARDALERMRDMVKNERRGFVPNALAVLAEIYCDKLGDPVKGEEISRVALTVSPHYANAHFQLGKALVAQKRFDEARAAYEEAIADREYAAYQFVIDDQVYIWKSHSEIGSSYVMQGNDAKALEWFDKGLKNAPKAEPLHINRAKALERLERFDEARAGYRNVYEMYRSEHAALEYINYLLRRGQDADALVAIEESYASISPKNAVPTLLAAAAVAQKLGSFDDERYLRAALAVSPGAAEVLDPLEAILRNRGKEADIDALIVAEDATEPVSVADFVRRGRRAIVAGDFARAAEFAAAGSKLAPENPLLNYTAAAAASNLDKPGEAIAFLDRIGEAPADVAVAAYVLRAGIERTRGNLPQALAAVENALGVDPVRVDALLVRAELMRALGSAEGEEESLKRAFEADPQRAGIALSTFYLQAGRFQEAASIADRALQS